jgi:hypothetical protein
MSSSLEGDHVTRDQVGTFNLAPVFNFGFGGEGIHEGLYGVTGVAFFIETNGRVDEDLEKKNNTDKVRPVRRRFALTV